MSNNFSSAEAARLTLHVLLYENMTENKALVILCGLPAAGKSTLAYNIKRHVDYGRAWIGNYCGFPRAVHVEFDSLGGSDFSENRQRGEIQVQKQLHNGGLVICDDNQFYKSMRKTFTGIAKESKASYCEVFVHVDVKTAIIRDSARPSSRRVGEDVILRMSSKFETPKDCITVNADDNFQVQATNICRELLKKPSAPIQLTPAVSSQEENHKQSIELERRRLVREHILTARAHGVHGHDLSKIAIEARNFRHTQSSKSE